MHKPAPLCEPVRPSQRRIYCESQQPSLLTAVHPARAVLALPGVPADLARVFAGTRRRRGRWIARVSLGRGSSRSSVLLVAEELLLQRCLELLPFVALEVLARFVDVSLLDGPVKLERVSQASTLMLQQCLSYTSAAYHGCCIRLECGQCVWKVQSMVVQASCSPVAPLSPGRHR